MQFDVKFFESEVREGFRVSSMMKRAWAAQLEVLHDIDEVCKKHNISYHADGGTLLGAVRHGGFIPWDDDIDIGMKRLDYERFLRVAVKELPAEYRVLTVREKPGWKKPFARVVNGERVPLQGECLQKYHGFPYLVGIDIFPVDYLPVDKNEENMQRELYKIAYLLAYNWEDNSDSQESTMESLKELEDICNVKFSAEKSYEEQLWNFVDRISSMYWDMGECAESCALMYWLTKYPDSYFKTESFRTLVRVPFENTTIPIPIGYDQVLTAYYGKDYMVPRKDGGDHEYPFYRKQEKELVEFYKRNGMAIPEEWEDK